MHVVNEAQRTNRTVQMCPCQRLYKPNRALHTSLAYYMTDVTALLRPANRGRCYGGESASLTQRAGQAAARRIRGGSVAGSRRAAMTM